jgi:hypothetical protein
LARRRGAGRLRHQGIQRPGPCIHLSHDNEDEARQAKVLAKDEAVRIAFNVARLPELLGEADEDRKLKADQAERLGKKLTVHVG